MGLWDDFTNVVSGVVSGVAEGVERVVSGPVGTIGRAIEAGIDSLIGLIVGVFGTIEQEIERLFGNCPVGHPRQPCPHPPVPPTLGALTVQVLREGDDQPIAGATVRIEGPDIREGVSNAQGLVTFDPVREGDYSVSAIKDDFQQKTGQTNVPADQTILFTLRLRPTRPVNPRVNPATLIVLVKKPQTTPRRVDVTLSVDNNMIGGTGTVTLSKPTVKLFDAATAGNEIPINGVANVFTHTRINAGVHIFVEGLTASTAVDDTELIFTVNPSIQPAGPPAKAKVTAVELILELCKSRTSTTVDPVPLTDAEKQATGRFIHVQDAGNHHGRAMLRVRRAKPATFTGTLSLTAIDAKVTLFNAETGGAAAATPQNIVNTTINQANGQLFFAQGVTVSGALRDTGFKLGLQGGDPEGDSAPITVVQLTNLAADVPSTPANTNRAGNSPVARATLNVPAAAHGDEDYATNPPLVLVEDSVIAGNQINMSCQVAPAGVPVLWAVHRDARPAPNGDAPGVISKSPNATPTITPNGGNPLRATLQANAVGSFHVRAYVDGNGNSQFDYRIDKEPFCVMNYVLIAISGFRNNSRARTSQIVYTPAAPTSASGLRVRTGTFANGPTAACHNDALVTVIGGGRNGRRGLTQLFGGWINNELSVASSTTVPQSEDVEAHYLDNTVAPPVTHFRKSIWTTTGAGTTFTPPPLPPAPPPAGPNVIAGPVLDTTNFGAEGTGGNRAVGTEGAVGPPLAIVKTNLAVGQRWRIQMWDSPGDSAPVAHGSFPGPLVNYRFNIDFRSDLSFWTNTSGVPGPTADPACRLYSTALTNTWQIRIAWSFNAATGAGTKNNEAITMAKDGNPTRKARAVDGSGCETRAPISLRLLAIDART